MDNIPSPIESREALLIARRAAGLSQHEMALCMHMTQNAISKVETGATGMSTRFAAHAALVLAWHNLPEPDGAPITHASTRSVGRPANAAPIDPHKPRYQRRAMNRASLSFNQAWQLPEGTQYQLSCSVGNTPWSAWVIYERSNLPPFPENDKLIGNAPPDDM